jgi:CRP-like cAMP-binding protein
MKKYTDIIQKSKLFAGINVDDIEAMLGCLGARTADYPKNATVLREGNSVDYLGLLLDGEAHVIQEDFWGNRNIITSVIPGQLFAESFACMHGSVLNVNIVTDSPSVVLFLNVSRLTTTCSSACAFHNRVIMNLLADMADKNLRFNEKLTHMAQRTTREKLLSYLSAESIRHSSQMFDIPYNRQQLADYLSVDRSAMSNELSKLRDEGVILFERNHFELCR